MIYSRPEFIFLFLVCLLGYLSLPTRKSRFYLLLGGSFFFYAWAGFLDTFIFLSVIVVSWLSTWLAHHYGSRKKLFLGLGIAVMALHLFFWKYAPWLSGEIIKIFPGFLNGQKLELPLPVGISFFTLQGIAYLVDYERGEASFIPFREYTLFKSFFPQLVAGPIVRVPQLLPQLRALPTPKAGDLAHGLSLFAMGFFKKIVVADRCAPFIDRVFYDPSIHSRQSLVVAALGYSVQIWADFSGYTDMGRGCARMLGIHLPENFLSPYLSKSPSEFWTRWHITLSQWIRDYIYIPLGGNQGSALRVSLVLLITMLISGLWHGANWTFLVWGIYHGLLLAGQRGVRRLGISRLLGPIPAPVAGFLGMVGMFLLVTLGWILFRCTSLVQAQVYLSGLLHPQGKSLEPNTYRNVYLSLVICFSLQAAFYFGPEKESLASKLAEYGGRRWASGSSWAPARIGGLVAGVALAGLCLVAMVGQVAETGQTFIYFQF